MYNLRHPHAKEKVLVFDGREDLTASELEFFLRYALARRERTRGKLRKIFTDLEMVGRGSYVWNATKRRHCSFTPPPFWLDLTILKSPEGYRVTCQGTHAFWAVERANEGPERLAHKLRRRKERQRRKTFLFPRPSKKYRRHIPRKKKLPSSTQRPPPAPQSEKRMERLKPQFRRNHVFWGEAVRLAARVFEIKDVDSKRSWKRSPEELVTTFLLESLEQNGGRFTQIKRRGFCLRFDLMDGRWRGDITPLALSCTKDNKHPAYRQMRECLKKTLLGLSTEERRDRKERAAFSTALRLIA